MNPPVEDQDDDERRGDKRRFILLPIDNERRRGQDRRKTWELTRSSGEIDPLPMARRSGPTAAVLVHPQPPMDQAGGVIEFPPPPERPPLEPRVETPPNPTPIATRIVATAPTALPTEPRAKKPIAEPDVSAHPPTRRAAPKTKPAEPPERKAKRAPKKTTARKPPPATSSSSAKPSPKIAPTNSLTSKTSPPRKKRTPNVAKAPPTSGTTVADGDLWIGVPEGATDEFLTPSPPIQTHRYLKGAQGFLVTLCYGPVATMFNAWRPVNRKLKRGTFRKIENQMYQRIGSERGTKTEFQLAYQTVFEAFPEIKNVAIKHDGAVVTIDV